MSSDVETLGIIAGNRSLPFQLAQQARNMGVKRLVAAAFENETDPKLTELVDEIEWMRVGQLNKLSKAFSKRGVKQCVMVGQIAPKNLFDLRPDFRALGLLMRLKQKNAHTIFGGIADELAKDGVELISALPWLTPLMPGPEFHLGPNLSADQLADVKYGHHIALEVSRLEIGQIVVVKKGTCLQSKVSKARTNVSPAVANWPARKAEPSRSRSPRMDTTCVSTSPASVNAPSTPARKTE